MNAFRMVNMNLNRYLLFNLSNVLLWHKTYVRIWYAINLKYSNINSCWNRTSRCVKRSANKNRTWVQLSRSIFIYIFKTLHKKLWLVIIQNPYARWKKVTVVLNRTIDFREFSFCITWFSIKNNFLYPQISSYKSSAISNLLKLSQMFATKSVCSCVDVKTWSM